MPGAVNRTAPLLLDLETALQESGLDIRHLDGYVDPAKPQGLTR
jgi:hypothetical protein